MKNKKNLNPSSSFLLQRTPSPGQLPSSHNHPSSLIFHPIISVLLKILFITLIKASIAATKWKKMKFGQKKEDGLVMKTEGSKT